jgi:hypothetical protein
LDYLDVVFRNCFEKEEAADRYARLVQSAGKDFNDFHSEFARLTAIGEISPNVWQEDLYWKLNWALRLVSRHYLPQMDRRHQDHGQAEIAQVYPQSGQDIQTDIDIYAIPGLDAKAPDTWVWVDPENKERKCNWLKDPKMIPHYIPNARIFTYNWNSDLFREPKTAELIVAEHARCLLADIQYHRRQVGLAKVRPVVFIASCLGGIVLADALSMTTKDSDYASLINAVVSIIFLATPFRGTSLQDMFIVALGTLSPKAWWTNKALSTSLLNDLGGSTQAIEDVVADFTNRLDPKVLLYCFYETEPTNLVSHAALQSPLLA